jgi:hypothetical protein
MSVQTTVYDVFLSYSLTEGRPAELVERALGEAGLNVFNHAHMERGRDWEDVLRFALAECAAVVVVIDPRRSPAHATTLELGAAMAWHKPIYLVLAEAATAALPAYLQRLPAYSVSRVDDLVQCVKRDVVGLTEQERSVLLSVYGEIGIPVEQLVGSPEDVDAIERRFNARRRKRISGERLVQELVRLSKSGELPALHK